MGWRWANDETAWCALFCNYVLGECGFKGTQARSDSRKGSLSARSFLNWGEEVTEPGAYLPGQIVVLWRGTRSGWKGHVGFFLRMEGGRVWMLGGNQDNSVSAQSFPVSRILSVRRIAS